MTSFDFDDLNYEEVFALYDRPQSEHMVIDLTSVESADSPPKVHSASLQDYSNDVIAPMSGYVTSRRKSEKPFVPLSTIPKSNSNYNISDQIEVDLSKSCMLITHIQSSKIQNKIYFLNYNFYSFFIN